MKFLYDLTGADTDVKKIPVFSNATLMPAGSAVIKGPTAGSNGCYGIVASGALADVIGVLEAAVLAATTDSAIGGTALNYGRVIVNPFGVWLAEYAQTTAGTVAATSSSSGTTVNMTSIENMTGGFLYCAAGPSAGTLQYVVSGTTNVAVTKTAFSPVLTTASYLVKVLPQFHETIAVVTAADYLASAAAAGAGAGRVLTSFIQYDGIGMQELVPSIHSGLTGLNSLNVHLYSAILFLDHCFNIGA